MPNFLIIYPQDTPNIGRYKINYNFSIIAFSSFTGISASIFTNPNPTTRTVGGIQQGTTFVADYYLQDMMDLLLYPASTPNFTSFLISGQPTQLEVGTIVGGIKTFTWGMANTADLQPNSIDIEDTTNSTAIASNLANDGSETVSLPSVTKTSPGSNIWTISAEDTDSIVFSRTYSIDWVYATFYGVAVGTALNAAGIVALPSTALQEDIATTYVMGSGGYGYVCVPDSFSTPSGFKNSATNLPIELAGPAQGYAYFDGAFYHDEVSVTRNGIPITYRVYRTLSQFTTSTTVAVSISGGTAATLQSVINAGNIAVGNAAILGNFSATTFYSGNTPFNTILSNLASGFTTYVQPGLNVTTGGTVFSPIINVAGSPVFTSVTSNSVFSTTLSGGTIYSGSSELGGLFGGVFAPISVMNTYVQPGLNITTGGTPHNPIVNSSGAPTFTSVTTSTLVSNTITGTTFYSGNTPFNTILSQFAPTYIQPGFNILTGGTISRPIISTTASPVFTAVTSISISGNSISGTTFYSGNTPFNTILANLASGSNTYIQPGLNITTGGTVNAPVINLDGSINLTGVTATTISGNTVASSSFYSGTTNINDYIVWRRSPLSVFSIESFNVDGPVESSNSLAFGGTMGFGGDWNVVLGSLHSIEFSVFYSSILGGLANTIRDTSSYVTILGGTSNQIDQNVSVSSILGGESNTIETLGLHCSIINSYQSLIGEQSEKSIIVGGNDHVMHDFSYYGAIVGGSSSQLENAISSAIIGGSGNMLLNASASAIIGGQNITGTTSNMVYVPNLNISSIPYSSSTELLFIQANGNVTKQTFASALSGLSTYVQPGLNITTGGTSMTPIINLSGSIILTAVTASSVFGNAISATTFYSGNTDLNTYTVWKRPDGALGSIESIGNGGLIESDNSLSFGGTMGFGGNWNIALGSLHTILDASVTSAIIGGESNTIGQLNSWTTIIGGVGNTTQDTVTESEIIGGEANTIEQNVIYCSIVGGQGSIVREGSSYSNILGGNGNDIFDNSYFASILGGLSNVSINSQYSSIIAGNSNMLFNANRSVVIGGQAITGTTPDTVYVPNLSIKSIPTSSSTEVLLVQSNGYVTKELVSNIFSGGGASTYVQPGLNIITGGTASSPIINTVGSPTFTAVTAADFISGSTNVNDLLASSLGGNGSLDNGLLVRYNLEGQIRASVETSTTPAIWASSLGTGNAGYFNGSNIGEMLHVNQGGSGIAILAQSTGGYGLEALSFNATPLSVNTFDMLSVRPDFAHFYTGLTPSLQFSILNDGALFWSSATGAQRTRTFLGVPYALNGNQITTGGTALAQTINLVASPAVNNLIASGISYGLIVSGGTIYSGGTDLSHLLGQGGASTYVQSGLNITTGGTANAPIVNLAGSISVTAVTASGAIAGATVAASGNLSGATIYEGSTLLSAKYAPKDLSVTLNSGTYILALTDDSRLVDLSGATVQNCVVPRNSSVAFPIGSQIMVAQTGAGQVTFSADTGVSILSYLSYTKMSGQYAVASLVKKDTNTWILGGNLSV